MRNHHFFRGITRISLLMAAAVMPATMSTVIYAQVQPDDHNKLLAPLPQTLVSLDGHRVETVRQWEETRREEVMELFREHVYGRVPAVDLEMDYRVTCYDGRALSGNAVMKEVEVSAINGSDTLTFNMLVLLPAGHAGPVPLFLGLNFYGNQTVHPDPAISLTESWCRDNEAFGITGNRATERSRGVRASRWPVELILSRGYGLATIYYGDIDPDFDDGFRNGIHGVAEAEGSETRDPAAWGSIAAWAWGLSRAMDYLVSDWDVDPRRVAVIGHSRLGKTALWAGATDERFSMVVSNNSGCGGAALSRRAHGETVSRINEVFPHWFADRFNEYNDNEAACPVDQHMLMALVAPRPLYVASAAEDDWADPLGEYLSLVYGSEAYGLYDDGSAGYDKMPEMQPDPDRPRWTGKLGYHVRSGKHDITRFDWEQYLAFADQHLKTDPANDFQNPVTRKWIGQHLRAGSPRLILTPGVETALRAKLDAGDPLTRDAWELLVQSAEMTLDMDTLVYRQTGRRLLGVSREAIRRLTSLALAYRIERDQRYLDRLEAELRAVCSFKHWNPSHFLDVAEMAAGVALALDWAGEWLPAEVNGMARKALVEKALKPGMGAQDIGWVNARHNWNLVCHGGLSLAALAVFEDAPDLATGVLHRAVEKIPLALAPYGPDGVYPEGASYWFYATTYLAATISACESALGTDFGFTGAPGVMESATFSRVLAGPSGDYYNFFDAGQGGYHGLAHFGLLAWFAKRSGEEMDLEACGELLKKASRESGSIRGTRFYSMHLMDLVRLGQDGSESYMGPPAWVARGDEPIGVFRDPGNPPGGFYLAAKGGMAADNHGNMDAGSFILELEGVRWSVDPGNQGYHELEQIMGTELWNNARESPRWSLLTKNNSGHSTLTVDGGMHRVDGRARLVRFDLRGDEPNFTLDLTPVFGGDLLKAERTFIRMGSNRLVIRDDLVPSDGADSITWQMITVAGVEAGGHDITLYEDGKVLRIIPPAAASFRTNLVGLSPPPLAYDKDIPGLKRLELVFSAGEIERINPLEIEITTNIE